MSDYAKITNFTTKDSLTSGDAAKAVKGSDIDAELAAISVAILSKYDSDNLATQAEAEAGTVNTKLMTPLRTAQQVAALVTTQSVYKTAAETVSNDTTLQDDNELTGLTVVASGIYRVFGLLSVAVKTASDLKIALTLASAPTALSVQYSMIGNNAVARAIQTASGTGVALAASADETVVVLIEGIIQNDTDATTLKLQWAQNAAVVENTTLNIGSFLTIDRIG